MRGYLQIENPSEYDPEFKSEGKQIEEPLPPVERPRLQSQMLARKPPHQNIPQYESSSGYDDTSQLKFQTPKTPPPMILKKKIRYKILRQKRARNDSSQSNKQMRERLKKEKGMIIPFKQQESFPVTLMNMSTLAQNNQTSPQKQEQGYIGAASNPKRCTSHQNMLRPYNEEDKYMTFDTLPKPEKYDINSQGLDPSKEVKLNNMRPFVTS